MASLPPSALEPCVEQRPASSYPHQIHNFFRSAARKKSINDLSSAIFHKPSPRPRTGSEACLERPQILVSDLTSESDQQRIESHLPQRSSTLRARGSRRTRSSFGGWINSINEFRREAGSKMKSRGHFSRKSIGFMDIGSSEAQLQRDHSSESRPQPSHTTFEGDSVESAQDLRGEQTTPILEQQIEGIAPSSQRTQEASVVLGSTTEKLLGLSLKDSMDLLPVARKPSNMSDAESGIGVDMNLGMSTISVVETRIAGHDPAALPRELFDNILVFLDAESLLNAEVVSKAWNSAARSDHIWKHVFHAEFVAPTEAAIERRELSSPGALGLGRKNHSHGLQQWKVMWRTRRQLNQRWRDGHAAAIYLEGHTDSVYCAQFDEQKVITGSRDWTLRVWDAATLKCTHVLGKAKDNSPPRSSLDSREHHGQQPFVSLLPSGTPTDPLHIENDERHIGSVLCMQYDEEIMVTGSSDTTLIVWDMKDYSVRKCLRHHSRPVLDVCLSDKYIIACSKDMTISVWSRETLELVKCLEGHRGPVNAVQTRGNLVCSACGDGIAKLWDLTTGLCIKEFQAPQPESQARSRRGLACIEFTKDGRILAGGNDRAIFQFNTVTGSLEHCYDGHDGLVRSLHYDAANHRVVSGSYDHSVKAYDLKTKKLICDFKDWTTSWMLNAKSDYRRIVATSQDARAVVMDFGFGLPHVGLLDSEPNDSHELPVQMA